MKNKLEKNMGIQITSIKIPLHALQAHEEGFF